MAVGTRQRLRRAFYVARGLFLKESLPDCLGADVAVFPAAELWVHRPKAGALRNRHVLVDLTVTRRRVVASGLEISRGRCSRGRRR